MVKIPRRTYTSIIHIKDQFQIFLIFFYDAETKHEILDNIRRFRGEFNNEVKVL